MTALATSLHPLALLAALVLSLAFLGWTITDPHRTAHLGHLLRSLRHPTDRT